MSVGAACQQAGLSNVTYYNHRNKGKTQPKRAYKKKKTKLVVTQLEAPQSQEQGCLIVGTARIIADIMGRMK